MQNGSSKVQETNQNLIKKIYGQKESESEIDFEEEPRTSIMPSQNTEDNFEEQDDNYLFAETIEEEEVLRLEQKEIEMIKKSLEYFNFIHFV